MKNTLSDTMLLATGLLAAALITGCGSDDDRAHDGTSTVTVTSVAPGSGAFGTTGTPESGTPPADVSPHPGPPAGSGLINANPDDYRSGGSLDGDVAFVSPTGNVWCRLGKEQYTAGCQAKTAPIPAGADCRGSAEYPASMLSRGFVLSGETVTPSCFNQGVFTSPERKPLPYGYTITDNGYTCTSRESGVTCTTPSGEHGFVLSMQEARAF
ncbi:hypothetical protein [Gordonia sp. (in: high G+C Gram-positive bacteria)]|uniref:hypothetical protein n=1 Tax=Gordonia sp. (in: high G+C Gram-positive bacteria) TaxID=84139 RepID=UPI0026233FD8|nr:hypothetical protein [Gordonia sp. (in: high G+C Gram-positive bacteria)]